MKQMLYILFLPLIMCSQTYQNDYEKKSSLLTFSLDFGFKFYTGNLFLEQQSFSREGVFINFNAIRKKEISNSTYLFFKAGVILSNAVSKKIQVSVNYDDNELSNYFITKVPNILSCNINYSFEINKKINHLLSHSAIIKFRLFSLFYKKGNIFGGEINSFGGFISSEENGSLPGLEKASNLAYSLNYLLNNQSVIKLLVFINSDWSRKRPGAFNTYPGFSIKLERLL